MKQTRVRLLGFTMLTSLALAPAAFADAASEALVKDFIAKLDASAKWDAKASAVTSEGAETVIANLLISEAGGPAKFEAASIRVKDLAQTTGGGISLSHATITQLTAGAPQLSITAPEIKLEDFTSPGLQGWEFDSKQPITSMMRLYTRVAKTEFGLISIPSLATSQVIMAPGVAEGLTSTSTMSGMRYEKLKGGVLASMTSGKFESATAGAGGPNGPMVMQWDGFSAKNVNFASLARVFDPDTYTGGKGDGVWMDALETASYGKMVITTGGKQSVTLGGIDISGVQLRQPEHPLAPIIDQLGSNGGNLPPDQSFALFEQYGQSLTSWFRLSSLKVNAVKVVPPEGGAMEIDSIALKDLSPDGLRNFVVEGSRFSGPHGGGGLKLFEIEDLKFPAMSSFLTVARFGKASESGKPVTADMMQEVVPAMFDILPRIGKIGFDGFSTSIEGADTAIAKFILDGLSPEGLKRVAVEGFTFIAPQGAGSGGLKRFEISKVEFPAAGNVLTLVNFAKAQEAKTQISAPMMQDVVRAFIGIYPKIGKIGFEGFSFAMQGMEPLTLESLTTTASGQYLGPIPGQTDTELKALKIPGGLLRLDPQMAQIIDGLGYQGLEINAVDGATLEPTSGAFSESLTLTVKDAGTLRFGFNLNGLTQQRIEATATPLFAARSGAQPDIGKVMAAADGFTFNGAVLRFEDASLTKRAIALIAKMQGVDQQTLIGNATALMQLGLAELKHPGFTAKAVAAVSAFLANPKSITIALKPAQPVGVAQMVSINPGAPNQTIDLFGVTVSAND